MGGWGGGIPGVVCGVVFGVWCVGAIEAETEALTL